MPIMSDLIRFTSPPIKGMSIGVPPSQKAFCDVSCERAVPIVIDKAAKQPQIQGEHAVGNVNGDIKRHERAELWTSGPERNYTMAGGMPSLLGLLKMKPGEEIGLLGIVEPIPKHAEGFEGHIRYSLDYRCHCRVGEASTDKPKIGEPRMRDQTNPASLRFQPRAQPAAHVRQIRVMESTAKPTNALPGQSSSSS